MTGTRTVILGQAGRGGLTNYTFVLEAPWKACRLCGTVYQSDLDREAYKAQQDGLTGRAAILESLGKSRRETWLLVHNKTNHPNYDKELRLLNMSGLDVTPEAAQKLSTYGIVVTQGGEETALALLEAPRCAINDVEGT